MSEISWRIVDRRPLLPVLILSPDVNDLRTVDAVALVDTGATASAVTRDLAERLALPVIGKRLVASAHGDQHVDRYIFRIGIRLPREGEMPAFPFVFEAVEGFRIRSGFAFDALLGMDVLSQCDLTISGGQTGILRFG
ncbi:aspartyl protease family protein [Sphingomonas sp. BIUV-7]|uniref:Aspartyl protease family protein n=1 Tax=Sphingomonas natans TaxID=3063330 RepID=A0ABT8YEL6_9SPHN|nr:aspartyl protease family protein [Sphingomonas sp. BIUV-7]MDO6416025.1 aspartyl protease family protein [Sphingomonas sp. BIUV-7]